MTNRKPNPGVSDQKNIWQLDFRKLAARKPLVVMLKKPMAKPASRVE